MPEHISILIIEDTPDHAELARMTCRRIAGCTVEIAESMDEARGLLDRGRFDLILSDLNLPDSGRDETVQMIRSIAPHTALIVMTSDRMDEQGLDSIAAGAQMYIRKDELSSNPIERTVLHAIQRQCILNENTYLTDELQQRNLELEIAQREVESAIKAKGVFFASVSHEIRTPMTAILGFVDVAMGTVGVRDDPVASDALGTVRRNGAHLLTLINDILDIAKVESGTITLEQIPTSLTEEVRSLIEMLGPLAREKGLSLEGCVDAGVPGSLLIDPTRTKQILVNLIGNAIKFTETGSIQVEVSAAPVAGDEYRVTVRVRDTGVGMNPGELARIREFGMFIQANAGTTRRYGGTGLGLRMCQGLAELMGGSIGIESELGAGSTVSVEFVASSVRAAPSSSAAQSAAVPDLSGMRVLIVDDSEDNQRLFEYYLGKLGAGFESVSDGDEAVERMSGTALPGFDLILMDLQMPRVNGFDAMRAIRALGVRTPMYATSASASSTDQQVCERAGFDGFIAKPIDRDRLFETLESLWAPIRGRDRAA